jgi:1,4-dihydroxy-6-naphthoate synthase
MKLSLGFSPCPNDTFIFDALVNGKIDTKGLDFEVVLADVQTLNEWAISGRLDLSKISYGVLPKVLKEYVLLESGGALGRGVGPLLISPTLLPENETDRMAAIHQATIAIPGIDTTAHLLFSNAYPGALQKIFLRFDEIENWVLKGNGLGVIIHENRFTYAAKGLHKVTDLGSFWESSTGSPIPLGGIVGKRNLDSALLKQINGLLQKSVIYAFENYPLLPDYVKMHAQEMEETIMRQHIDLYVNDFSLDMGASGKNAIRTLLGIMNGDKEDKNIFLS